MKIIITEQAFRKLLKESIEDILYGKGKGHRGYAIPNIPQPKRRVYDFGQKRDPNDDMFDGMPHSYTVSIWDNSVNTEREFSDTFDNIRSSRELDDAVRAKYPRLSHWRNLRKFN